MWSVTPCWPTQVTRDAVFAAMCATADAHGASAMAPETRVDVCDAVVDRNALASDAQRRAWLEYARAVAAMNTRAIHTQLGVH